jgi:VIT1/CCC1 family predicted Fe2+/Mn2+ transporter
VHARAELGITELSHPRPFQATAASAASFAAGGALPVIAVAVAPSSSRTAITVAATTAALAATGWTGALLGGAPPIRGALRVVVWGLAAIGLTMLVGRLVGSRV